MPGLLPKTPAPSPQGKKVNLTKSVHKPFESSTLQAPALQQQQHGRRKQRQQQENRRKQLPLKHTHTHHMQTHTHTYTPHANTHTHTHTHTQSDKERKEKKVISKICKHSTSNVRNLQVAYCDSVAAQLPNRKLPEINSHSKVAKGHNKKYIICSDPRGNLCNYAIVLLSVAIPEKCANS